jgi:hypothetical protein
VCGSIAPGGEAVRRRDAATLPESRFCRAPNTHSTAFAVRILPKRTAKGARRIFTRQRTLPCALGKRNARHSSLPCVIVSAIKPFEGFGDVDHTLKELMSF